MRYKCDCVSRRGPTAKSHPSWHTSVYGEARYIESVAVSWAAYYSICDGARDINSHNGLHTFECQQRIGDGIYVRAPTDGGLPVYAHPVRTVYLHIMLVSHSSIHIRIAAPIECIEIRLNANSGSSMTYISYRIELWVAHRMQSHIDSVVYTLIRRWCLIDAHSAIVLP